MEEWKQIEEFSRYDASINGQIRNHRTGRILKTFINSRGYEVLTLRHNGEQYTVRVNRLIGETFYDHTDDKIDVCYKDGNKLNNSVGNLEICTRKENIQRSIERETFKFNNFGNRSRRVLCVETGEIYESLNECSRQVNIDRSEISKYLLEKKQLSAERTTL